MDSSNRPSSSSQPAIIVLDIGETVRDDSNYWAGWAVWLGVSPHTFSAVLGALRHAGYSTNEVFDVFRPGVPYSELVSRRTAAEGAFQVELYGDVKPFLRDMATLGIPAALAGNQDMAATESLRAMGLGVRFIESSATFGCAKPEGAFFEALIERCALPPDKIIYVGDNYEADLVPAREAGLKTALIRRGPWAYLHLHLGGELSAADHVVTSLGELSRYFVEPRYIASGKYTREWSGS